MFTFDKLDSNIFIKTTHENRTINDLKISEFIPTGCIIKPMSPAGGISSIVNSSSLKLHYVEVSVMPSV